MLSLAFGPITTMSDVWWLAADSGSTPLFFSSTTPSRAACSASCLCFFDATTDDGIFVHSTSSSLSKSPSSKRATSRRFRLMSICFSLISPRCTAVGSILYAEPHSRSVPLLTALAEAAAKSFDTLCSSGRNSRMAQQSLVINPLKPHSSRSIWRSKRALPQHGCPSMLW